MKQNDVVKLSINEFKYDKRECILSDLLQIFILSGVFFLFTIFLNLEGVASDYIQPLYEQGFEFELVGYTEADNSKLENMGFFNITYSEYGSYGYVHSLENIWIYKIKAAIEGKDIWSGNLDEIISVILFTRLVFLFLGVGLLIIMYNNIANSYTMKLINRQKFISMMFHLGAKRLEVRRIFNLYFLVRMSIASLVAILINSLYIKCINAYISKYMFIFSDFPTVSLELITVIIVSSFMILIVLFCRRWRKNSYE